jgi:hypothetical protein
VVKIEEIRQRAAQKLWAELHAAGLARIPGAMDGLEVLAIYTKVAGRVAEDPDFQLLVISIAQEMASGEAKMAERRAAGPLL